MPTWRSQDLGSALRLRGIRTQTLLANECLCTHDTFYEESFIIHRPRIPCKLWSYDPIPTQGSSLQNTNPEIHEWSVQAETISVLRWLIIETGEKDVHSQWNGNLPGTKPSRSEIQLREGPAPAWNRLHVGGGRNQHKQSPIGQCRELTQIAWFQNKLPWVVGFQSPVLVGS